jgi:hypothetical protein
LNRLRPVAGSQQARQAAKTFLNQPLTNADSGIVATVSGESLRKMLSKSAWSRSVTPQAHMRAVGNLDTLFTLALLRQSRPDRGGDPNIRAMHHFDVPMPFQGQVLRRFWLRRWHARSWGRGCIWWKRWK